MKRLTSGLLLAAAVLLGGSGCGDESSSGGACQYSSALTAWCSNFDDAESCHTKWSPGTDCASLGYTEDCGSNAFVTPGRMCP